MLMIALAVLVAQPTTLMSTINAAKPGDHIRLVAGKYPGITLKFRTWSPAISFDASAAEIGGVWLSKVKGVHWRGGTMVGTNDAAGYAQGYGLTANYDSADIIVENVRFSNFRLGVGFDKVMGGRIAGNWMTKMSSDGIDVSKSHNIVVDGNTCSDFKIKPLSHGDCIQMWSRPPEAPTGDITISNNTAIGPMAGIGMYNHPNRNGVDDGGYDRVIVRGNKVLSQHGNGILVHDCRGCTVRDNVVDSLPNYTHSAQLYILRGSVTACGNIVPKVPRQASPPCANTPGSNARAVPQAVLVSGVQAGGK